MAKRNEDDYCPSCGRFWGEQPHSLNFTVVRALRMFYEAHGTEWAPRTATEELAGFKDSLPPDELNNLQKLSHWLFVEKLWDAKTGRFKKGWWRVTESGELFLKSTLPAKPRAITRLGEFVRFEGEPAYVHELEQIETWQREEHIEARRQNEDGA